MDIKSKEERSLNMSKIRAKNTKPELFVRSELHKAGYRFRANPSFAEGCPDLYFTKKRVAIFIHGCYWHRHEGCKFTYTPKSNVDFWLKKFNKNIERDKAVLDSLTNDGVRVLIIWECTVKRMVSDAVAKEKLLKQIAAFIDNTIPQVLEL